jgi:acid phosphatase (class A)
MTKTKKVIPFVQALVLAAVVACSSALAKHSALNYLEAGQPDAATLLAPPPLADSPEQASDMEAVRSIYHAAGSNDRAAAYAEKKFSVFNFSPEMGSYFQSNSLPRTAAFFQRVQNDASTVVDGQKEFFMRPRPYSVDTNLANGVQEKSFSYPSGHSTESMVIALVLADLAPEKRDGILAHARSIGWHRVQIARHYPTDIYAGRVLAQAIVKQMRNNDAFKRDFAEAQKEIATARN